MEVLLEKKQRKEAKKRSLGDQAKPIDLARERKKQREIEQEKQIV